MAYDSAEIMGALKACGGKVYVAANRLGCSPNTIKNHMAKNPEMAEYVETMRTEMVDLAELGLKKAILANQGWAISLTLKTLGKSRGYVERTENVQQQTDDISHYLDMTEDEIDEALDESEDEESAEA